MTTPNTQQVQVTNPAQTPAQDVETLYYVKPGVGPTYVGKKPDQVLITSDPNQTKMVKVKNAPKLHELFPDKFVLVTNPGINGPQVVQGIAPTNPNPPEVVEESEYTEAELQQYTLEELKEVASSMKLSVDGLKKKEAIAAILQKK
jgi:hypothetical protein